MATLELVVTVTAFVALLAAGACLLWGARHQARKGVVAAVGLLLIFAVRWALTTPMFVHASLHGSLLLNAPYENPTRSFRNYGPFGSLVQGSVMHLLGADLTTVAMMNQMFAVLTVGLMGWVARRWTGSWIAAACVVAAAALNPVLMRQGSSEDGHNLAVLLAWMAIAAMEHYAATASRAALIVAAASVALMVETRQIMFAFIPLFPLLGLLRARFPAARRWDFQTACTAMVAALVLRLFVSFNDPIQAAHVDSISERMSRFEIIAFAMMLHPMLAVPRFATHLLPLYAVGAAWMIRGSWAGRMFVACWLAIFASSLWLLEGQNVSFMFRMPVLTLALFVAGLGAWQCGEWLVRRFLPHRHDDDPLRLAVYGCVLALLCVAPVVQPGWAVLHEVTPLTREYEYIKSSLPKLPRQLTLVREESQRGLEWQFPTHLLDRAGIQLRDPGSGAPRIFLKGVRCRAYSMSELLGFTTIAEVLAMPRALMLRIAAAIASTRVDDFDAPAVDRRECAEMLHDATPLGLPFRIEAFPEDPPFVLFGSDSFDVQLYQLPNDPAAAPSR